MRRRSEGKLEKVAEAALEAFTEQGYRLTQMSDIARRAGISAGALYLLVEGKEALLRVAFLHAAGLLPADQTLPVKGAGLDTLLDGVEEILASRLPWPVLTAARANPGPDAAAEMGRIVDELFDLLYSERRGIELLSRCVRDLPGLAVVFQKTMRQPYLGELIAYLAEGSAAGRLRPIDNPMAMGWTIIEMVSWTAMHRLRHPTPPAISNEDARTATRELVVGGVCR